MNALATLLLALPLSSTPAEERTADAVLAELDALTMPAYDESRMLTDGYAAQWREACREVGARRAPLIEELWRLAPGHERTADLLAERWEFYLRSDPQLAFDETSSVIDLEELEEEDGIAFAPPEDVLTTAAHYHAASAMSLYGADGEKAQIRDAIDRMRFLGTGTSEMRRDLMHLCLEFVPDTSIHEGIINRLSSGTDADTAKLAEAMKAAIDGTQYAFSWSFDNALARGRYRFAKQLGKVVVVEFWKTDDRASLERIPMLKRLRETFPEMELVGISMDDREGMKRSEFRARCAELGVDWVQYFQRGDKFYSEGWGVVRVPRTFVVGPDGYVRHLWVGDDLEEVVRGLTP